MQTSMGCQVNFAYAGIARAEIEDNAVLAFAEEHDCDEAIYDSII